MGRDFSERVSYERIDELSFLGRGNNRCREFEMGGCLVFLRISKEISLVRDW